MTASLLRPIITFLACVITAGVSAQTLVIHLEGLGHDTGMVRCGLFDDASGWPDEDRATRQVLGNIHQGRAVCEFEELAPGAYAVAAYHAEHADDRLHLGFLGRPEQAVGFSMNPSHLFGAPSFEDASFQLESEPLVLTITMD